MALLFNSLVITWFIAACGLLKGLLVAGFNRLCDALLPGEFGVETDGGGVGYFGLTCAGPGKGIDSLDENRCIFGRDKDTYGS